MRSVLWLKGGVNTLVQSTNESLVPRTEVAEMLKPQPSLRLQVLGVSEVVRAGE
jgi:hypothetical protein